MATFEKRAKRCPTDLTDAEWALVEPLLPKPPQRGRKPSVDMRTIMEAIRYMARAGGNSLFLEQLLLQAGETEADQLPPSILAAIQARLAALPPAERTALRAAAVLGPDVPATLLKRVGEVGPEILTALAERGLLCARGETTEIAHPLIREGILDSMLPSDARALHARAAAEIGEADLARRAHHLCEGADPGASAACLRASEAQRTAGALAEAVALAERGLAACAAPTADRADEALGEADRLIGTGALAHNHLRVFPNIAWICLRRGDREGARRAVAWLEEGAPATQCPWVAIYARTIEALASRDGPAIARARSVAHDAGFHPLVAAVDAVGRPGAPLAIA